MIVNPPNDGAISRLKTELAEAQADAAYWKKQYEEKTFDFSGATIQANEILSGEKGYDSTGSLITGMMTNQGAYNATTSYGGSVTIPAGYHNGSGRITGGSFDFSGANIAITDLPLGVYAWDANGQLIGRDSYALGEVITWDNKSWQIQHYDDSGYVYLALSTVPSKTIFGSNTAYSGSTLASVCSTWMNNNMSSAALAKCRSVTVNGVMERVFVPSKEQLSSEWDWPKAAAANRKCQYNGSATDWWTSSPYNSSNLWAIAESGSLGRNTPDISLGFRPAVKIPVSALR